MSSEASLAVHARLNSSRANGPGRRAVLWVQGCSLACPGCYNPETHTSADAAQSISSLLDWLAGLGDSVEGLSVSGGEPLEQPEGLLSLLSGVRSQLPELSILVFSGFSIREIRQRARGTELLALIDVLIDGRYVNKLHRGSSLRGSENQRIHCLTDRYTEADVAATPATEVSIGPDGVLTLTGVSPLDI